MDKQGNGLNTNKKATRVRPRSGLGYKEHLYKILVIGEIGTGKTSFIKQYVHGFFSTHYRATIGVDFALKVIEWDEKTIIRLQLWDIAGQERFGNMTRVYYKEAVGAIVVYDISRPTSFDAVLKWKSDLDSKVVLTDGKPIPCILLANKCDLPADSSITDKQFLDKFCKENNFLGWFLTSAKDNVNVEEAVNHLMAKILQNEHFLTKSDEFYDVLRLNSRQKKKSNCWCSS